mmetsp:Transcript_17099/g.58538  ORF Transcript_17099/g.58538 Transcript_17099/m.58538 type:complete len:388 (+) Transcript_17099:79-1242(+)
MSEFGRPVYAAAHDEQGGKLRIFGDLLKKGGSRGGRRNWQKRYFVLDLHNGVLRYYSDAKLKTEAGAVELGAKSRLVIPDEVQLRGSHAPVSEDEDPFYFELHDVCDDRGRRRPSPFALRAPGGEEFDEWVVSINFAVRQLKKRQSEPAALLAMKRQVFDATRFAAPPAAKAEDLVVVTFDQPALGLSLVLSRERLGAAPWDAAAEDACASVARSVVVVAETFGDRGGGCAHSNLLPDDELVAVLPEGRADGGELPQDLRVDDFHALLQRLKAAQRPLSLVFRRVRRRDERRGDAAAHTDPPRAPSLLDDCAQLRDAVEAFGDERCDASTFEYFVYDAEAAASAAPLSFEELRAKWLLGDVDAAAKIFVCDAWVDIGALPKLVAALQ